MNDDLATYAATLRQALQALSGACDDKDTYLQYRNYVTHQRFKNARQQARHALNLPAPSSIKEQLHVSK